MKRIAQIEKSYERDDYPKFNSGDTVRVHVKIKEGDKERVQVFQGTVIGRRGSGTGATFTVRKVSSGIGVERVFPLWSPNIAKIERIRAGQVRRKKLFYLRELTGKSARIKEQLADTAGANSSEDTTRSEDKAQSEEKPEGKAEKE
jgi:large subunit ribosomal protein L19